MQSVGIEEIASGNQWNSTHSLRDRLSNPLDTVSLLESLAQNRKIWCNRVKALTLTIPTQTDRTVECQTRPAVSAALHALQLSAGVCTASAEYRAAHRASDVAGFFLSGDFAAGGAVISMAQIAAGRMYMEAR